MTERHFNIRNRETLERIEEKVLSPFAAKSGDWNDSRLVHEKNHSYRTAFQRDRDRIIHSRAFRRLKHKRQVFLTTYGDHYRTRLTHTVEVAQLSRTIARTLGLNEDLVEAISLGHDLGHTPFGHTGEVVLHNILCGRDNLDGVNAGENIGGFKHNYQSLRIIDVNEARYDFQGLNLTSAVREGILKHTGLRRDEINYPNFQKEGLNYELDDATTLEGQVVAICDEIAQRTHDLEDGIRADYVSLQQVRSLQIIHKVENQSDIPIDMTKNPFLYRNTLIRKLVNYLVTDVINSTLENLKSFYKINNRFTLFDRLIVWFSENVDPLQKELDTFIMKNIISIASEKRSDVTAANIIRSLYKIYYQNPNLLPEYRLKQCVNSETIHKIYFGAQDEKKIIKEKLFQNVLYARAVCDYIAGMTDFYAERAMQVLENLTDKKRANMRLGEDLTIV